MATYRTTFAAKPAAGTDGDLWFPSGGFDVERDDGSDWLPWTSLMFPLTPLVDGDFSWDNQGTAALDTTGCITTLYAPWVGGTNLRVRYKSAPAVPYTVDVLMAGLSEGGASAARWGILFRESSSGKLVTLNYGPSGYAYTLKVQKFNSTVSFNSDYVGASHMGVTPRAVWWRLVDDNVNREMYWSTDGKYWHMMHQVGRTDFLTADQVGYYVAPTNGYGYASVYSWVES